MNDISRTGLDTETPVNPYSLLEAVNRSSGTANTAWLLFVGLLAYLLITVAGVTHKDLLLNAAITLPVLQVNIELTRFFLFAPIVLVLLHLGVVGQLVLLARKTLEFASSIRMLEISDQRTHPLRLELDNFFFVQAMAGPERSRIVSIFLHGMSWLTLVAAAAGHAALHPDRVPALPRCRHHLGASHRRAGRHRPAGVHRRVPDALGDLVLPRLPGAPACITRWACWSRPALLVLVACFSLFVVTIPGEPVDRLAAASSTERSAIERGGRYVFGYAVPAA